MTKQVIFRIFLPCLFRKGLQPCGTSTEEYLLDGKITNPETLPEDGSGASLSSPVLGGYA